MKSEHFLVGLFAALLFVSDCFAQNETVRDLQLKLAAEGFDPKGIDGEWGPGTESALKAYQAANNFHQTGRIEPESETARKLGFTGKTLPPSTPDNKWAKCFKIEKITIRNKVLWLSKLTAVVGDPSLDSKWNWETEKKEPNKGHLFVEVAWKLEGYEAPIGFHIPETAIYLTSSAGLRVKPIATTTLITPKGECWSDIGKSTYFNNGGIVKEKYLFSAPKEDTTSIQIECMGSSHSVPYEKEINNDQRLYIIIPEKDDQAHTNLPEDNYKKGDKPYSAKDVEILDRINSSTEPKFYRRPSANAIFENIKKDADQGYDDAQFSVGTCYEKGDGVAKDEVEAVKWYRMAAVQGNDKAQYALGVCYDKGVGVPKNEVEAVNWYRKAANLGNSSAREILKQRKMP